MWLFNRSSTAADTDNSDLKEVTHAQRQRNKQIEWLREKVNGILEVERDKKYRVIVPVNRSQITLDINLSDRFPFEGPVVTASPFFIHPWFDQQMVVVGGSLLKQFNPHCNLGTAVKEIIDELIKHPPQFDHSSIAMATQPQMYPPHQMGHVPYAVGGGPSLLDTPFSFSSAPHYSQTANIDTPPPIRSSSSTSPKSVATPPVTAVGPYSIPTTLPGLSEKTTEQLERYLTDEDAVVMIGRYISKLDVINKVQQEMESLFLKNEERSRENIEMEPELQLRWGRLQDKFLELQTLKQNFDKSYQKQITLLERYDRKIVHQKLKTTCQDSDTNSEIIAEDFMENKMDSVTFLQKFIHERKLYHLRAVKSEMFKHHRL